MWDVSRRFIPAIADADALLSAESASVASKEARAASKSPAFASDAAEI